VVRGQRKGAVAIACWWSPYNQPEFWLLRDSPRGRMAVSQPWTRGEGWGRACDLTQSAQLRGPTMEYLEKVRPQFLSLRQPFALAGFGWQATMLMGEGVSPEAFPQASRGLAYPSRRLPSPPSLTLRRDWPAPARAARRHNARASCRRCREYLGVVQASSGREVAMPSIVASCSTT